MSISNFIFCPSLFESTKIKTCVPIQNEKDKIKIMAFYFCFGCREWSHLTRDLSLAENKKILLQAEQMHKISLKMVEVVILSDNSCHFVSCSAFNSNCSHGINYVLT